MDGTYTVAYAGHPSSPCLPSLCPACRSSSSRRMLAAPSLSPSTVSGAAQAMQSKHVTPPLSLHPLLPHPLSSHLLPHPLSLHPLSLHPLSLHPCHSTPVTPPPAAPPFVIPPTAPLHAAPPPVTPRATTRRLPDQADGRVQGSRHAERGCGVLCKAHHIREWAR